MGNSLLFSRGNDVNSILKIAFCFVLGYVVMSVALSAADLKIPKPKLYVDPLPKALPELCIDDDGMMHGSTNQVAIADSTCKSGQRWRNK